MKNHFWKATKSSASLPPLSHTPRIGSTRVLSLTTVQYITLCPMESSCSIGSVIQLTIIVHVPPVQKYLNQRKWRLQKCLAVKRRPEHQELCIWSLRHGLFTVSSVLLLTRCDNVQASKRKKKRKRIYEQKGELSFLLLQEKLPFDDVELVQKDQLNQWQNSSKSRPWGI